MPLESCMICIDNSEYSRNGDYVPNRLGAQVDAVNMLSSRKINPPSHPESTVGILTMGGKEGVEVRIPPTRDTTKLLTATQNLAIGGSLDLIVALRIAQLALKHRQNKAGEQRIIAFVASPVQIQEKELKTLASSLRKEGIAIDIINMGEIEDNEKILKDFVDQVDKDGTSHLITIPRNTLPSNVLRQSPIFGDGGTGGGDGGGAPGGFGEMGGIDPNEDPEMAMVMQLSLMEDRARQEAAAKVNAEASGSVPTVATTTAPGTAMDIAEDEDALLQQALAMSRMEETSASTPAPTVSTPAPTTTKSSAPTSPVKAPAPATPTTSTTTPAPLPVTNSFLDPSFVENMLAGLPGVDLTDPRLLEAMQQLSKPAGEKKDEKKEDKK